MEHQLWKAIVAVLLALDKDERVMAKWLLQAKLILTRRKQEQASADEEIRTYAA